MPGTLANVSKTGPSIEPSYIENRRYGPVQTAWLRYGHANHAQVEVSSDVVIIAIVHGSQRSGRWDGSAVTDGQVYAYAPGSVHVSSSAPLGSDVGMLVVEKAALAEAIDLMGREARQELIPLIPPPTAHSIVAFHHRLRTDTRAVDSPVLVSSVLDTVTRALSRSRPARRDHLRKDRHDRRIVLRILDYLDAVEAWTAPMLRLCEVSGVSDRRIEAAFVDVFSTPPSVYLRMRALSAARTQLQARPASETTVSRVALDHDFDHLGRFSHYYRELYGESPSATLASAAR